MRRMVFWLFCCDPLLRVSRDTWLERGRVRFQNWAPCVFGRFLTVADVNMGYCRSVEHTEAMNRMMKG